MKGISCTRGAEGFQPEGLEPTFAAPENFRSSGALAFAGALHSPPTQPVHPSVQHGGRQRGAALFHTLAAWLQVGAQFSCPVRGRRSSEAFESVSPAGRPRAQGGETGALHSRTFQNSGVFSNGISRTSRTSRTEVREHLEHRPTRRPRTFENILEHSGTFENIREQTRTFANIREYSRTFATSSRTTQNSRTMRREHPEDCARRHTDHGRRTPTSLRHRLRRSHSFELEGGC